MNRFVLALSLVFAGNGFAETFLNKEASKEIAKIIPSISNKELESYLKSSSALYYNDDTMPKAHQDFEGALLGLHSPRYNISANYSEPYGNGNVEFPWGTPGGLHRVKKIQGIKFLKLPKEEKIKYVPYTDGSYDWYFPNGTIVGEVLFQEINDKLIAYEIRTRTKNDGKWRGNIFRPYPSAEDLVKTIKSKFPNYKQDEELKNLVEHLVSNSNLETYKLENDHPNKVFSAKADIDFLPEISSEKVVTLLTNKEFVSAAGINWKESSFPASAPSTKAKAHIVPQNYDGGFIAVDSQTCMKCHETTNQHVNKFEASRDWYGRIRGNDGIFSFHIFSPSSISYDGIGRQIRLNQELVDMDLLERK
jgi:cytochrome c5